MCDARGAIVAVVVVVVVEAWRLEFTGKPHYNSFCLFYRVTGIRLHVHKTDVVILTPKTTGSVVV